MMGFVYPVRYSIRLTRAQVLCALCLEKITGASMAPALMVDFANIARLRWFSLNSQHPWGGISRYVI